MKFKLKYGELNTGEYYMLHKQLSVSILWLTVTCILLAFVSNANAFERGQIRELIRQRLQDRITQPQQQPTELQKHTIWHQGQERTYYLYVPAAQKSPSASLLIALHGREQTASQMAKMTGFHTIAQKEGFLVAYPQAVGSHWNDGRETTDTGVDDLGFIQALVQQLRNKYRLSHVYVAGVSNGGFMTHRLACQAPSGFTAFAMVIASMSTTFNKTCRPQNTRPILMINGTADPLIKWQGGELEGPGNFKGGHILSSPDLLAFWKTQNACKGEARKTALPDKDPKDGTRVYQTKYAECQAGNDVMMLTIQGGGHQWPGPAPAKPLAEKLFGRKSHDIDASAFIWKFFSLQKS
jgi:polyhydroxybutyrate depolymerase